MGFIESFWGTQRGGNVCGLSEFSAQGAEQKGDLSHSYCGISQAPKAPTSDWFSGLAAVCRMEHCISASPKGSVYSEQQALLLVPFLAKKNLLIVEKSIPMIEYVAKSQLSFVVLYSSKNEHSQQW